MARFLVISIVLLGSLAIDAKPWQFWQDEEYGDKYYNLPNPDMSDQAEQMKAQPISQYPNIPSAPVMGGYLQQPNFAAAPYVRQVGIPHIPVRYAPHMPLHQVYVPHMFTQMGALPAVFCINAPKPATKQETKTTEGDVKEVKEVKDVKTVKDVKDSGQQAAPVAPVASTNSLLSSS